MNSVEIAALHAAIAAAEGSVTALRAVFEDAVSRFGLERASLLWWSTFAASDAAET